jgi:7-cyano-7-deazaguanine synthase
MKKEIPMAQFNCKKLGVSHQIVDVRGVFKNFKSALLNKRDSEKIPEGHYESSNMKKTVVPFRNGILLSIAAGFAESNSAKILYYGAHAGDHMIYPDCRKEFVDAMSKAFELGTMNKVVVRAPYRKDNKITILRKGLKLGVDYSKTWTCYSPFGNKSCGKCGSCQERLEAFRLNKIEDPLEYITREEIKGV